MPPTSRTFPRAIGTGEVTCGSLAPVGGDQSSDGSQWYLNFRMVALQEEKRHEGQEMLGRVVRMGVLTQKSGNFLTELTDRSMFVFREDTSSNTKRSMFVLREDTSSNTKRWRLQGTKYPFGNTGSSQSGFHEFTTRSCVNIVNYLECFSTATMSRLTLPSTLLPILQCWDQMMEKYKGLKVVLRPLTAMNIYPVCC